MKAYLAALLIAMASIAINIPSVQAGWAKFITGSPEKPIHVYEDLVRIEHIAYNSYRMVVLFDKVRDDCGEPRIDRWLIDVNHDKSPVVIGYTGLDHEVQNDIELEVHFEIPAGMKGPLRLESILSYYGCEEGPRTVDFKSPWFEVQG